MNITIYSTADCAACHTLTDWLESKGFKYNKKVTDEDPALMTEFMSVNEGMITVPFTIVADDAGKQTKISGFDLPKFKAALGI